MICENPFTGIGARAHACGACVPCRVGTKMTWKTRIHLEALGYSQNSFVTLTYRDDALVYSIQAKAPTLIPDDLKNWLKRFRIAYQRKKDPTFSMRFYAAGEYSPKERPHYHLILFGVPGCAYGKSRYCDGVTVDCCFICDLIRDTWGKGIIESQVAAKEHGGYVAGYVMKKMTSKHDRRLNGRHPEFSRQSNRAGGIGISAVASLAKTSAERIKKGQAEDVVSSVRIDGKTSPIGRYLRKKIRIALGGDGKAPEAVIQAMEARLLPLLHAAKNDPENLTLKKQIIARCRGEVASIKARQEMNDSRKRNRSL